MEYIITFSITIILTYIFEHSKRQINRIVYAILLGCIIILIPSILGGIRDISVGTDTEIYQQLFHECVNKKLPDIIYENANKIGENLEPVFLVYLWVISRITKNFYGFQFINSLLTFGIFFVGANHYKKKYSLVVMVSLYFFMFYCAFLNYARQGLALSIVFLSFRFMEEKNLIRFLITVIIAACIHLSAIVILPAYLLFLLLKKGKSDVYVLIMVIFLLSLLLIGPQIVYAFMTKAAELGFREKTILKYARRFNWNETYLIHGSQLLMCMPQLLIFTFYYKRMSKESDVYCPYYIMSWIQFALTIIGSVDANFARISYYYNYSIFILFGEIFRQNKNNRQMFIAKIMFLLYLVSFWLAFTVNNLYYFTLPVYPYVSILKL